MEKERDEARAEAAALREAVLNYERMRAIRPDMESFPSRWEPIRKALSQPGPGAALLERMRKPWRMLPAITEATTRYSTPPLPPWTPTSRSRNQLLRFLKQKHQKRISRVLCCEATELCQSRLLQSGRDGAEDKLKEMKARKDSRPVHKLSPLRLDLVPDILTKCV